MEYPDPDGLAALASQVERLANQPANWWGEVLVSINTIKDIAIVLRAVEILVRHSTEKVE